MFSLQDRVGINFTDDLFLHSQAMCPGSTEQEIQAIINIMIEFYLDENVIRK